MGFIYPQFLPAVLAGTICICFVNALLHSKEKMICLRKVFLIIAPLIISLIIILPYFFSISSGIKGGIELFKIESLLTNTVSYLIVCFPVLLIVFLNRKFLWNYVDRTALVIILTSTIISFGCYICMHMSYNNEYKALLLSEITLGILGGIALSNMKQWCNKFIVFIVLIACMFPIFDSIKIKLDHLGAMPIMFTENRKALCAKDTEEDELYQWIRSQTNVDDVFFDTTPNIPVFAQRQLFIAADTVVKGTDKTGQQFQIYNPGYNYGIRSHLEKTCGYDPALVRNRYDILEKIYNPNQELTQEQTEQLFSSNNRIFMIVRKAMFPKPFKNVLFDKVFQSSKGNFSVYCYGPNKPF
jgi:hypothetical protein